MKEYRIEIKKQKDEYHILIYKNEKLIETYKEDETKKRLEGNIYLGTVKDVVKGLQSAFIDIGEEKNALIHIKDVLPKENQTTGNVNLEVEKYEIQKILKPGEKILVQIKRDCDEQKGSRVTKDIKLTGKYIVLMPYSKFITVSSKITEKEEIKRLTNIVKNSIKQKTSTNQKDEEIQRNKLNKEQKNIQTKMQSEFGAIIRTSAEGKTEDIIKKDIEELKKQWNTILEKVKENQNKQPTNAKNKKVKERQDSKTSKEISRRPIKLYDNNGIIGKLIVDFEPQGVEIYADTEETKKYILENTNQSIEVKIKEIKDIPEMPRKIWLKCGGFITIDKCEALTAIDVNSGKFTGNTQLEDTVLKVNLEATKEIAKQIRLRDIGGIIIVDYIDMKEEDDRNKVREEMKNAVKQDRTKVQVLEFTKLGLLEITRKHILGR